MTRRTKAAVLLLLVLAGCGDKGAGNETDKSAGYATLEELADAIGCDDVTETERDLLATQTGTCTLDGETLALNVYGSESSTAAAVKAGRSFGGNLAHGDRWTVGTDKAETARAIAEKLHGETL